MKVKIAYIEEPPFGWTNSHGTATGADLDLADVVLRAVGVTEIEHQVTTFSELLPGVAAGRWDMNVPLFVTPERAKSVAFSLPVWAIGDGFLLQAGNRKELYSYKRLAQHQYARLGVIAGQVQHDAARAAGVSEAQIVTFDQQADAINAVCTGAIDAYASTALGNRILAKQIGDTVEAVDHQIDEAYLQRSSVGAFSFNKNNSKLIDAVNKHLRQYLGSPDHHARMAKYGLTRKEIDPALFCVNRDTDVAQFETAPCPR